MLIRNRHYGKTFFRLCECRKMQWKLAWVEWRHSVFHPIMKHFRFLTPTHNFFGCLMSYTWAYSMSSQYLRQILLAFPIRCHIRFLFGSEVRLAQAQVRTRPIRSSKAGVIDIQNDNNCIKNRVRLFFQEALSTRNASFVSTRRQYKSHWPLEWRRRRSMALWGREGAYSTLSTITTCRVNKWLPTDLNANYNLQRILALPSWTSPTPPWIRSKAKRD